MKKILTLILLTSFQVFAHAQQWNGNSNTTSTIYRKGNIGIGVESTASAMVPGFASLFIADPSSPDVTFYESGAALDNKVWQILANSGRFRIITENDAYNAIQDAFIINRSGVNVTTIEFPNGNIGVGVSDTKGYKLAVGGKIVSEEVVIKLKSSWPDYVFESTYRLPKLSDLERYLVLNKHLPGIPSATEVEQNGLELAKMQAKLLEKIEELTLYIIDLEKRVEILKSQVEKSNTK